MWPFKKKDPNAEFWAWFVKNERELLVADVEFVMAKGGLSQRLKRVHPSLVWELSVADRPPREFVLSADGDKSAFGALEALADAAPPLPLWKIIRFRPRVPDYAGFEFEFGDLKLGADDVEAVLYRDDVLIAVDLFIRGCPEEGAGGASEFVRAGFIMLDLCLGEYDVECKVGRFRVLPFDAEPRAKRIPWADLRGAFDRAFEKLHPPA